MLHPFVLENKILLLKCKPRKNTYKQEIAEYLICSFSFTLDVLYSVGGIFLNCSFYKEVFTHYIGN